MSLGAMEIAAECVAVEHAKRQVLRGGVDLLGRREPRRLGVWAFASAIPGWMELFRRIDAGYWDRDGDQALCWCPCLKSAPAPKVNGFARCSPCGRLFIFDGRSVWVARLSG